MRKIAILAFITSFFLSLSVMAIPAAQAQGGFLDIQNQEGFSTDDGNIPGQFGQSAGSPSDIRTIIAKLIKVVLTLLATIFLVLMFLAGFKWMTASGNESQIDEAKKTITQSVIGLAIVLSAYAVTSFVFNNLLKITSGTGR